RGREGGTRAEADLWLGYAADGRKTRPAFREVREAGEHRLAVLTQEAFQVRANCERLQDRDNVSWAGVTTIAVLSEHSPQHGSQRLGNLGPAFPDRRHRHLGMGLHFQEWGFISGGPQRARPPPENGPPATPTSRCRAGN